MVSIAELFHSDLDVIAYRLERQECLGIVIRSSKPKKKEEIQPLSSIMKIGGWVHLPGLGYVEILHPGLYRVYHQAGSQSLQWIVYDDDPVTLAASVSGIFYHHADEPKDLVFGNEAGRRAAHAYVMENMHKGQVGAICLTAASSFVFIAASLGIKGVVWELEVLFDAAFLPSATHAVAEIEDPENGQRYVIDIDKKCIFPDGNGGYLSMAKFVERALSGRKITTEKLVNTRYAGYGKPQRLPIIQDFINDLYECAGQDYNIEVYERLGNAEFIRGVRYYGGGGEFILPHTENRLADIASDPRFDELPDRKKDLLTMMKNCEVAEF